MSVASALTTLSATSTSWAADPVNQSASQQVRYRQAHEAFKSGKWLDARRLLLDLWKEKQTFDVAVTLVQVEYQLTHYAAAARYLRFALDNVPPTEKPETARDFKQQLDELRKRVGTVTVQIDADSADVLLDGELAGTSPLAQPIFVDPGEHKLKARLAERAGERDLKVVAGESYTVDLKIAASPAIQSGLPEKTTTPPQEAPSRWWSTERTAVVGVGGGLTLLAAGIGIAFRIDGSKKQDDVDTFKSQAVGELGGNCAAGAGEPICRSLESAADGRNSSNRVSTIAFVTSGVLLAATATTVVLWPRNRPASASVAPVAGPGFAGVFVKGAF